MDIEPWSYIWTSWSFKLLARISLTSSLLRLKSRYFILFFHSPITWEFQNRSHYFPKQRFFPRPLLLVITSQMKSVKIGKFVDSKLIGVWFWRKTNWIHEVLETKRGMNTVWGVIYDSLLAYEYLANSRILHPIPLVVKVPWSARMMDFLVLKTFRNWTFISSLK